MKISLTGILDRLKNDFHIPVGLGVFGVTSVFHFWTGKDLGPQYVNSIYALYAFLGGHALGQMKWGGGDATADSDSKQ
jgi:hypothetical protein